MSKVKIIDIIWEYTVKEKYLDQFLRIYSPGGEWVKLFREYPGFIKTELKQDISDHCCLTVNSIIKAVEI
ncbi:hypothetical protein [Desulfopila aestuarii]|uniref:Uncharacterized protein n=1 Tax=Desulfopila aestuarii DSM 18488 TaxID=1121416 RepID=A0A1M7YMB3_9BACT|nr:hypothetical protein [Desulfopila aestuarii]SHO53738.1 hypothetical protein SAMN02745220_05277 [Desulfopila aestuarii DSM 18488]